MLELNRAAAARWQAAQLSLSRAQTWSQLPLLEARDVVPLVDNHDLWDMWHLQRKDGSIAILGGRSYWFFLFCEQLADPGQRHYVARMRLLTLGENGWQDHGEVLPRDLSPGACEWSGSALLAEDETTVTLFFTATGRREGGPRFEQRLFAAHAQLERAAGSAKLVQWSVPHELFAADGTLYAPARDDQPTSGLVLGFRDPGYFCDPADGREYILFTGSAARANHLYNGVIGIARRDGTVWTLLPPLVDATGVAKELERAHIVIHNNRYYLFWSTPAARFAPGVVAPTGLYGMVADALAGPWHPLNGSTLVATNPGQEPIQAYCWWVTAELNVMSFIDTWGMRGRQAQNHPGLLRKQFGGTIAPQFRLRLDGDRATILAAPRSLHPSVLPGTAV